MQQATAGKAVQPVGFRFLNPAQAAAVEAVTDQIIPADDQPGAKAAGVVHYIDLLLTSVRKDLVPAYSAGVPRLDAMARQIGGKRFAELPFSEQTKVLEKLELDETPIIKGLSGRSFFELMRGQTLGGFYGDPNHDRSSVGWKNLGFSG